MKKILLILMAMFAFGLQNVSAQDAIKIVTNHPDFNIKVKRCAASGKTVVIDLVLTNLGTNDVEGIDVFGGAWDRSEAYDDEGNIYKDIRVKVANKSQYDGTDTGPFNIPTGVPMRVSIQINNVSTSAESIARLKLIVDCRQWDINGNKPVKFSNIPISRQ